MEQRLNWIDVAKGVGMILVIIGHVPTTPEVKSFVFSFHMPLFFFLSGLVFKQLHLPIKTFFQKKVERLLFPYICFSIITYLFWFFVERYFPFSHSKHVDPFVPFTGIFISNEDHFQLTFNPAIWFLTVLFLVEVVFFLFMKLAKGRFVLLFTIGSALLGYISTLKLEESLPWNAGVACTALVFYALGYLCKPYLHELKSDPTMIVCALFFLSVGFLQAANSERIDMRANQYGEIDIFYLTSILGIAGTIYLTFKLKHSNMLRFLGKNSLTILVLHFIGIHLSKAFVYFVLGIDIEDTYNLSWTIFYSAFTIVFMIPCILFFNKYPVLLGRKKRTTYQETVG
ncbi:acyltransferase family protein [Bacillus sp. CLL-7-23]|uniref:Acyltransferase family protein n=1 Tax=Bacillus changyiensis TaxID=3004103 RepID=A0ABT4X267_9BACI|nr:acyltransferase family protein [Bacillus changyiensis]MDA7026404.1 acyltransferase family protein [Bacillus changyiensis]